MPSNRLLIVGGITLLCIVSSTGKSLAGAKLYEGSWIVESFGNDKVGIGTEASQYFQVYAIPFGYLCHGSAPRCDFESTPVTTASAGTEWSPRGPGCRPLTVKWAGFR